MLSHFSFFLSKSYLSSQVLPLPQSLSPPRPHTTSCTPQVHSACPRLHSLLAKQGHLALLALWGHWEGRGGEMTGNAAALCARHRSRRWACIHSLSSQQASEKHTIISPLQMWKQMRGDTAKEQQGQSLDTGSQAPEQSVLGKNAVRTQGQCFPKRCCPRPSFSPPPQSALSDQTPERTRLTLPWGAGPRIT